MPLYVFECAECKQVQRQPHDFGNAPPSVPCLCGGLAGRIFTPPRLITQPHHLREENRLYGGLSGTDALAERKREDVEYEQNCVGGVKPLEAEPDPYEGVPRLF